jgi:hypothetical protein
MIGEKLFMIGAGGKAVFSIGKSRECRSPWSGILGLAWIWSPKWRTGSKCEDLKSSPVSFGGFEMASHTNFLLLKLRWINFDPVQLRTELILIQFLGQSQYTSPGIQYYHVSKIKQYDWLIYHALLMSLRLNINKKILINKFFVCLHDDKTYNSFICGNTKHRVRGVSTNKTIIRFLLFIIIISR